MIHFGALWLVNYVGGPRKMFVHCGASYFAPPAPSTYLPLKIYPPESARGDVI